MFGRGSIFLRLLAAVLLIVVLAGAGWMIFQAGQAQGYAMGAAQSAAQAEDGQNVQPVPPAGRYYPGYYGYGYGRPHFFPFFPLAGLFGFLIFFLLIGGLFRAIFWGWRGRHPYPGGWYGGPGYPHHHGGWGEPPAEGPSAEKKTEEH